MPKRKREHGVEGEGEAVEKAAKGSSVKQQRVAYKLQQGVRKVAHAFKLAKGFERQKLSRRRKTATSQQKPQDVERIDTEIAALKALEHATAAQQYVYKSLLKIKAVAEHPDLPAEAKKATSKVTDAPTLNAVARLCKSNQAKEALAPVIADVQNAMGLEGGKAVMKKRKRARDYKNETGEERMASADGIDAGARKKVKQEAIAMEADGDSEEDEFAGYDDRIAMSDEEDEGSDDRDANSDQSVADLERQLESEGIRRKPPKATTSNGYNHEADLSLSESSSAEPSPSPEPQKAPPSKSTPRTKSSFLPTLTMGGYISGSGSEVEDEIDVAPKKNRRGQRARQQLWEKKYGSKAKHLQKESGKGNGKGTEGRQAGWDAKRGATDGSERFGRGRGGGGVRGRGGARGVAAGMMKERKDGEGKEKKHRDDGGAIHPSWEAAKKAKERKEKPVAFQGKKTTFD